MFSDAPNSMSDENQGSIKILQDTGRRYFNMLLLFWGGYLLLNLIFMGLWGAKSFFLLILFLLLSIVLASMTHALRYFYKHRAHAWPLYKTALYLLWALPLLALAAQALMVGLTRLLVFVFPVLIANNQPISIGGLLGYAMNYCIMLTLWCAIYLLRAEFTKRRHSEVAYWQLQAQLKDNELQFLRSQINSHFLFNAINNLRTLITEDAQAARKGMASLSVLLRGLLQSDSQQLVTLRDELDWVQGYLYLESLQFEHRLSTHMEIDENLLTAKLPPLVMQTLVENAIKHGIAARRQGGELRICIQRISTEYWQIEVQNPLPEFQPMHIGNQIGLRNTRERLHMAFGHKASLDLEFSTLVTTRVQLPL